MSAKFPRGGGANPFSAIRLIGYVGSTLVVGGNVGVNVPTLKNIEPMQHCQLFLSQALSNNNEI